MKEKIKSRKGFLTVYAIVSMLVIIIVLGVISFNIHSKYITTLKLQAGKKDTEEVRKQLLQGEEIRYIYIRY